MKRGTDVRPHERSVQIVHGRTKITVTRQDNLNLQDKKEAKPVICEYCNTPFATYDEKLRHIRNIHSDDLLHKCTECDYASVSLPQLRRHVALCHTGEKPYQCAHCPEGFSTKSNLRQHLPTHTKEAFTQSNASKAHNLTHHDDMPRRSLRSDKSFPEPQPHSSKVLNKTQEGKKSFKCELCPYSSITHLQLKKHMLEHTDEKPYIGDLNDQPYSTDRKSPKVLLRRKVKFIDGPDPQNIKIEVLDSDYDSADQTGQLANKPKGWYRSGQRCGCGRLHRCQ